MTPWQRRLLAAVADGGDGPALILSSPRMAGKREATLTWATVQELRCASWDVIGPGAPALRREARERAARIVALDDEVLP